MLSKIDIDKELGKGINIVPFDYKNIKENSINLSASKYAWAMSAGEVKFDENGNIFTENSTEYNKEGNIKILKGESSVRTILGEEVVILLPFSTTLIQTKEVIAVSNYIGGTYHSKVGIVSQGIGHIGTMLGPNFAGHSLIAVHNVSKIPLKIKVKETFVSIVFHYLNAPIDVKNATVNGHIDKMAPFGIHLDLEDAEFLNDDWKSNLDQVREEMNKDLNFKDYKRTLWKRMYKKFLKYINWKSFLAVVIFFVLLYCSYLYASYLDLKIKNPVWVDRFWTVGCSGVFIFIAQVFLSVIKKLE